MTGPWVPWMFYHNAVGDKLTILFNSGICIDTHIMKALSFGAKAVLIGRSVIFGLNVAGQLELNMF